jgi:uncharacterized protein YdhG (YjbR/CyaY superfamily)
MAKFNSVDEFIDSLGEPRAATVRAAIKAALAAAPDLGVKLAWNIPQVHRGKHYVMGFGPAKGHISIAAWSKDSMAKFADRLAMYDPTENMFRVPIDWKVDKALIVDMVKARLSELQ